MISLEREQNLSELEQKLGYSFRKRGLLDRALTHRSFANEQSERNRQHNEALEFLGDAVLGLIVSDWLLYRFPHLTEGKLSKIKAHLVNETSLVEMADSLELGRYLLLNRGEEKTGGRQKRAVLADACEAVIGALFLDGGLETARKFLHRELSTRIEAIDPASMIGTDFKSTLQERLQAAGLSIPEYVLAGASGPDHKRTFQVEVRVAGQPVSTGEGRTIKQAQQEAARAALAAPDLLEALLVDDDSSVTEKASTGPTTPEETTATPTDNPDDSQPEQSELAGSRAAATEG